MDPSGWPAARKRAWLENLQRLHAERQLLFTDLSATPIDEIHKLAMAATGGNDEQAHRAAMAHYKQRLLDSI